MTREKRADASRQRVPAENAKRASRGLASFGPAGPQAQSHPISTTCAKGGGWSRLAPIALACPERSRRVLVLELLSPSSRPAAPRPSSPPPRSPARARRGGARLAKRGQRSRLELQVSILQWVTALHGLPLAAPPRQARPRAQHGGRAWEGQAERPHHETQVSNQQPLTTGLAFPCSSTRPGAQPCATGGERLGGAARRAPQPTLPPCQVPIWNADLTTRSHQIELESVEFSKAFIVRARDVEDIPGVKSADSSGGLGWP